MSNAKTNKKIKSPVEQEWIELIGVRENNLKNISVKIPKNKITVVTGLSGSGKSSLVFETLFLESQRRFLDGLSNYSKNFLDTFKKPDVDQLKSISPAIAVDQKTAGSSPRSTVGTMTEILDYIRLLYARLGVPMCPTHNLPVEGRSTEEIFERAKKEFIGKKVRVLCPVVQAKKGEFKKELKKWETLGFLKAIVDGEQMLISEVPHLHKRKDHTIDLIVDQFKYEPKLESRLKKSMNRSFETLEGMIAFEVEGEKKLLSVSAACPECGFSFPELEPRHFSFNNKMGACIDCNGLGTQDIVEFEDEDRIGSGGMYMNVRKKSYQTLTEDGVADCSSCHGTRLNGRARSVLFQGKSIDFLCSLSVEDLLKYFKQEVSFSNRDLVIGTPVVEEIMERLFYLTEVGTSYLSLDRRSESLSGGERQRLRLASQLGSPLVGVLYVLDEPSIGLHAQDHEKLLKVVERLKDQGNTVVIVEHDEDTMKMADYIVEIGPGAGRMGGEVIKQTTYPDFYNSNPSTLTSAYLTKEKRVVRERKAEVDLKDSFSIKNAQMNNLKSIDVTFPAKCMIGVSGVSGSGKSSLVMDTLAKPDDFKKTNTVFKNIDRFKVINTIDQKPIGKTPRSVPATYVGVYQLIRDLYTRLPESQVRGFKLGHFSFNSELGRCSECNGHGVKKLGSHFLTDVSVSCTSCSGKRFKPEVLSVQFKGKNIFEVLDMSIDEAYAFFENQRPIRRKLQTLVDVGMGYIKIGQDSTTLSGGESQRLKLSKELSKQYRGEVLYILDEPTTGLHFEDVERLINILSDLVDKGHTVVVIEHQLDLLAQCDYLVDIGPQGGVRGGTVVDAGTPAELAKRKKGPTGKFLAEL